jgi:hypothetical protein
MSEWQPIETAPKDGTRVIVAFRNNCVTIARWSDACAFESNDEGPHWVEWECDDHFYSSHLTGPNEPTHWMPLPEPPK